MFCLAIPLSAAPSATLKNPNELRRVLIFNSYHRGYSWTDDITDQVMKKISARFPDVEYYVEFMDSKRKLNEELIQNIRQNLIMKYAGITLDVIVTSDDDALLFMKRFHHELFPTVPLVFCGVNDERNCSGMPRQLFTGVIEVLDIEPNIELILRLCPETRKIYVISDGTTTGLGLRHLVGETAKEYTQLEFVFLKGEELSTEEMLDRLRKAEKGSVGLMNVWFRDKNDQYISYENISMLITANCPAPIFGMVDILMGRGGVGGKMNSGKIQGRYAGDIAVTLMEGKRTAADIPICTQSINEYMFDYRELQRFGISESLLPQGSTVYYRPFSFYQTYKELVWGVIATMLLFSVMIIALVINSQRLQRAKKQLAQSEKDLEITLNSIGDGVIAADIAGRIIRMNPVAERLTGWSVAEAQGCEFSAVFHALNAETRKPIASPVNVILNAIQDSAPTDRIILVARDKHEYLIAHNGAPIRNEANAAVGVVLVFRDVTEESALEDKLRQAEKLQSVGQLAGGIAHDFNNMLAGIIGSADLLLKRASENEIRYVRIILDAATRASELTAKLLVFSRKNKIVTTPVDVHAILKNTVGLLEHSIDKKITIAVLPQAANSVIIGEDAQLQNAFLNLCINASQAMPNGGDLELSTRNILLDQTFCNTSPFDIAPGEYIDIEVKDSGCGIPKDIIGRIFEPFFTTKELGKGTGLGLSAVYGTVQNHHGAVSVYSEVGVGTVFHIYLPVSMQQLVEAATGQEEESGTGCILVVDDEELVRLTAQGILEDLHYHVITATDGQEAIDVYRQRRDEIDLIILDMIMPHMNGTEAFERLMAINDNVRILISSGFTKDEDINAIKIRGRCDFIRKPYFRKELSHAVAALLRRS